MMAEERGGVKGRWVENGDSLMTFGRWKGNSSVKHSSMGDIEKRGRTMLQIPAMEREAYDGALAGARVPRMVWGTYRKWLRYYFVSVRGQPLT